MLQKIKYTLKHTTIYSLGNITTKLIGIILLPLYTKHITVSEYGVLGILESTILILTQVLILGQQHAFLRFHDLEEYKNNRKTTLFTIFIFIVGISIFLNLIGQCFATKLASLFAKPVDFTIYFRLSFYIIALRLINKLFLNALRAKEKSTFYVIGNILKLAIVLGFNIYFVAFAKIGVKGILYSYLIGDAVLFLILFPNMIFEMIPKFNRKILIASLTFGFPLIFTALAGMLLNQGDRYILKYFVDYREAGLYILGYKIAGVLNMFFIQSFSMSLLPIAYKMYGQKGDKRYYSKMLTYFVFVLFWAGLGLALFGKELIKALALNPDYWLAYTIVPYIILGYIFSGARSILNLGLYLKKKTKYIAYNTIGAAVLNIVLNFILIPKYEMIGAAVATVISFITLYFVTYFVANRFYKIPYENMKLVKMLILAVVLFFISTLTVNLNILPRILIKVAIIILFPFILYPMKFYEPIEILRIKQSWQKWKNPKNWRYNITKIKLR
ncbi:MAG: polysaccharide biosynthesis C-terminal domain-containing protein [Candidatus Cloacimonetes bacterium]|nr:polysaccharide biosynthesis C-terminal domain-containing protein [Candidatus Cloacimonadota bacterium]